jgi:monoamine oxidase
MDPLCANVYSPSEGFAWNDSDEEFHVAIVGAGIAGLTCARELLRKEHSPNLKVTVLEAANVPGGRIRSVQCPDGTEIDVGAEFVHGYGTALTDLIEDLFGTSSNESNSHSNEKTFSTNTEEKYYSPSSLYEPVFVVSHADGGPDEHPTPSGMYGMYYVDGALRAYDDPLVQDLRKALDDIMDPSMYRPNGGSDDGTSVGDALDSVTAHLSNGVRGLANASYANTAGCSDLYSLSLTVMRHFEKSWFRNESAGDFRLRHRTMKSVVNALVAQLRRDHEGRFRLLCNWKAQRIRQRSDCTLDWSSLEKSVRIESSSGVEMHADFVVVAVPPPLLQALDMNLSPKKQEALSYVGFERAVKIVLLFSSRLWPSKLQGMVCADDLPIPEIWFYECNTNYTSSGSCHIPLASNGIIYIAVGFCMSKAADAFVEMLQDEKFQSERFTTGQLPEFSAMNPSEDVAAHILIEQLAHVLTISKETLQSSCVNCILFDWKMNHSTVRGGYMHGKKGMKRHHFQDLAEAQGAVFFAGEATNTEACCTIQAAMETGVRSSNEVVRHWRLSKSGGAKN